MTAQYNVGYTLSVITLNCAGNSTTAEYNFSIGEYLLIDTHYTDSLSGACPVLTNPMNGAFGPVSSIIPGSTVAIQCDSGYVSAVAVVTCQNTLMWSPNPEAIECTSLPTLPPTTRELNSWLYKNLFFHHTAPMNCTAALPPPRNGTIGDHSVPAFTGTQVTFQCGNGLFPEGIMTTTCLATGEWDKNPGEIVCRNKSSK